MSHSVTEFILKVYKDGDYIRVHKYVDTMVHTLYIDYSVVIMMAYHQSGLITDCDVILALGAANADGPIAHGVFTTD